MGDAPEKKRRKLTTALKEAIGAHSQKPEENIEKPIALALTSDNKAAQDLLNKIQASRRPQAILEVTLKVCQEKKSDACVHEAFLSVFRKHFSILGIDSAIACWKLIEDRLNASGSLCEIAIANEFINSANLLGHGFGKLLQVIKSGLPAVIRNCWKQGRQADSLSLAYSLICLVLAENVYGDNDSNYDDVVEYWKKEVLVEKTMKKDFGMRMISALAGVDEHRESLSVEREIEDDQLELLSMVYINHLEFFSGSLHESNSAELLSRVIESHLKNNQLTSLASRVRSAEVENSQVLYEAAIVAFRRIFEVSDSEIILIDGLNSLKLKEVVKNLTAVSGVEPRPTTSSKTSTKVENFLDFIRNIMDKSDESNYLAALSLFAINISTIFDKWDICGKILKKLPQDVLGKLSKAGKGLDNKAMEILRSAKAAADEENAPKKFVNRTGAEVIEKLESPDVSIEECIELLEGVHSAETKKEVLDSIVKFVEELPGGESLLEIKLFKTLIEMYGGTPLESLALQVVFSRVSADGWTDFDRTPGTEKTLESWFDVMVEVIDLLDVAMKSAKNSIIKSYTALYCQLFSQVLKNTQKFVRHSENAVGSQTLTPEMATQFTLRRHKLNQDVARLVDAMKRNESYFAMLTASIIGDAVFHGSDSLLAMAKLHSLADKNASALLATNLPVVERTRYKKFLSTITKASKRVY